jgi:23S rRNA (guanosine2251-2'-O)-methyltransferase
MNHFPIRLILDNIRSSGNVGSILRTADATNVEHIYACGTTPYPNPLGFSDTRPPHVASSNHRAIAKTALGAENTVPITYYSLVTSAIHEACSLGFKIIVIEQSETALNLYNFESTEQPLALIVGNEVDGVSSTYLALANTVIELPMLGQKESLNVAVATAVALYQLRFGSAKT